MFNIKGIFGSSDDFLDDLPKITKDRIHQLHNKQGRRICFSVYCSHMPRKSESQKAYGKIKWPFSKGIELLTPFNLRPDKFTPDYFWASFPDQKSFDEAVAWCEDRKNYIYLYDALTCSAALGQNKLSSDTPDYTEVGRLVSLAKEQENQAAINQLVSMITTFLELHPIFKKVDYICAMPAPHKKYDLPRALAATVSGQIKVENLTKFFIFKGEKTSAKKVKSDDPDWFEKKWQILEEAQMEYNGPSLKGKSVLLIDDNYQSGTSVQFIASILQKHGATQIYSLCMTKTLGDRGN